MVTDALPSLADIDAARQRCRRAIRTTPLLPTTVGDLGLDMAVGLKLESLQHAGSFKSRGSLNSALIGQVPDAGLIAASGGNHGIAVARTAAVLGVAAEIFVPEVSAPAKVARLRRYGATVHVTGALYDDAQAACAQRQAETGALEIHPYNTAPTIAGQGTLGLELADQWPDVDTVLVAVGGGGLIAGIRLALTHVHVVGVETRACAAFHAAVAAGQPTEVTPDGVAADALGARKIGELPWQALNGQARSVVVEDAAVLEAQRALWNELQVAAEPAAAVGVAALRCGAYQPGDGERVAVIVCGGNVDPATLNRL